MRCRRTSHCFRRLSALTLLSVLALLPLSVQFHAFHHGHGAVALLDAFDHAHDHVQGARPDCAQSDADRSVPEHAAIQALDASECDICDLFVTRTWLHLENQARQLETGDSALALSRFGSRLAVQSRLVRSRGPPA